MNMYGQVTGYSLDSYMTGMAIMLKHPRQATRRLAVLDEVLAEFLDILAGNYGQ